MPLEADDVPTYQRPDPALNSQRSILKSSPGPKLAIVARLEMRSTRPTRADVAAKAGVAPSTVTLVLGGKGRELRIPESTQERVREAARSLGYYPNRHIQSVLKGRSGVLGLYLRWDQWAKPVGYWTEVVWTLHCAAAELDTQLLVHNARCGASTEESFARHAGGIVDGVMIVNSSEDPIVGRILEARLPAVEVGDPFSQLPFVGLDAKQGIRLAMEHLKDRGYKRPALVDWRTNYVANAVARESEFRACAKEMFRAANQPDTVIAGNGEEAFQLVEGLQDRPDALLCAGDELAFDLLHRYNRTSRDAPKDIAIVGFDALHTLGSDRVITSVKSPIQEMARLALRKLLEIVDGNPVEHETLLPMELRVGDTT